MVEKEISLYDIQKALHQYDKQKRDIEEANTEQIKGDYMWYEILFKLFGTPVFRYTNIAPSFRICKSKYYHAEYDDICVNGRYIKRIYYGLVRLYISFDIEEYAKFLIVSDLDFIYEHTSRAQVFGAYSQMLLKRILEVRPKYNYRVKDWRFYRFASKREADSQMVNVISMYMQAIHPSSYRCRSRKSIVSKMFNVDPKMVTEIKK